VLLARISHRRADGCQAALSKRFKEMAMRRRGIALGVARTGFARQLAGTLVVLGVVASWFGCGPAPSQAQEATSGEVCSSGSGPSICISKSSFAQGESIAVQFSGGPGEPKDWIAVYPTGDCNPTCPVGSTLWEYCATDTHEATASGATSGTVTIDSNANPGSWPLSAGSWDLLYLVNDAYSPIAKLTFQVEGGDGGSSSTTSTTSACDETACSNKSGGDFCSDDGICCGTTCGCKGSGANAYCSCNYSCE
jgi:hypothetical protein